MEGRASNFKAVLADFEARLKDAEFVAIDTELTGVDLDGEPDTFEESAQQRLEKICRIAERYTLIQLGLTIVGKAKASEGKLVCTSYNLFAFPYVGPELHGRDNGFYCQPSALRFNAQHHVNFNTWIGEGISYMNREDERKYLRRSSTRENGSADEKVGLLRLWKVLCQSRLPFVVHCPLDLFFLLAAFERRPLPGRDPRVLALMLRQCTPKVYDTAHIQQATGRFKHLALLRLFEEAKAQYEELATSGGNRVPALDFELQGETAVRYRKTGDDLAHEAGFDSLITAQLFLYLRALVPARVKEAANHIFLYRSVEYLDLDRAGLEGQVGTSIFDLSRVTLLVAVLDPVEGNDAPRLIGAAGSSYKWMDSTHVLVVLRASGGAAVRKAAELAAKVHGVVSWMGFDEWRTAQASAASKLAAGPASARATEENGGEQGGLPEDYNCEAFNSGRLGDAAVAPGSTLGDSRCRKPGLGLLVASTVALLLVLVVRGRMQLTSAGARLLRRWRWR